MRPGIRWSTSSCRATASTRCWLASSPRGAIAGPPSCGGLGVCRRCSRPRAPRSSGCPDRPVALLQTETAIERLPGITALVDEAVDEARRQAGPDAIAILEGLETVRVEVAAAVDAFRRHLEEVVRPGAVGEGRLGAELFAAKLRHSLSSDLPGRGAPGSSAARLRGRPGRARPGRPRPLARPPSRRGAAGRRRRGRPPGVAGRRRAAPGPGRPARLLPARDGRASRPSCARPGSSDCPTRRCASPGRPSSCGRTAAPSCRRPARSIAAWSASSGSRRPTPTGRPRASSRSSARRTTACSGCSASTRPSRATTSSSTGRTGRRRWPGPSSRAACSPRAGRST